MTLIGGEELFGKIWQLQGRFWIKKGGHVLTQNKAAPMSMVTITQHEGIEISGGLYYHQVEGTCNWCGK